MSKKQIVKITYPENRCYTTYTGYGIDCGNGEYLTDRGDVIDVERYRLSDLAILKDINMSKSSSSLSFPIKDFIIKNTRNVPSEIRSILESAMTNYLTYTKYMSEIKELEKKAREFLINKEILQEKIFAAKGLLTSNQFLQEFRDSLSATVQYELDNGTSNQGYYQKEGSWKLKINSLRNPMLLIERDVLIEKYFRKSTFTYEEYDGEIFLTENAEKTKAYQNYLRKFRKELSLTGCELKDNLSAGGSLWYHGEYEIPLPKELTKESAKALAEKVCGIKRVQVQAKPNENKSTTEEPEEEYER